MSHDSAGGSRRQHESIWFLCGYRGATESIATHAGAFQDLIGGSRAPPAPAVERDPSGRSGPSRGGMCGPLRWSRQRIPRYPGRRARQSEEVPEAQRARYRGPSRLLRRGAADRVCREWNQSEQAPSGYLRHLVNGLPRCPAAPLLPKPIRPREKRISESLHSYSCVRTMTAVNDGRIRQGEKLGLYRGHECGCVATRQIGTAHGTTEEDVSAEDHALAEKADAPGRVPGGEPHRELVSPHAHNLPRLKLPVWHRRRASSSPTHAPYCGSAS